MYNRLLSIFSSLSNICITIPDFNLPHKILQNLFKLVRRTQLMSAYEFPKVLLLVKNNQDYNSMTDLSLNTIIKFHSDFLPKYINLYKDTSEYYLISDFIPIPIGDIKKCESYLYSVWYTILIIFSQLKDEVLVPKCNTNETLLQLCQLLFGEEYASMSSRILELQNEYNFIDVSFPKDQKQTADIIKSYHASFKFALLLIDYFVLHSKDKETSKEDQMKIIENNIKYVKNYLFPYLIGNYNITIKDYAQYSHELSEDLSTFVDAYKGDWLTKMRDLKNYKKSDIPVLATSSAIGIALSFIPIVGIILGPTFIVGVSVVYNASKLGVTFNILQNKKYTLSIHPFIWNKNLTKTKTNNYDMKTHKPIGGNDSQLIVFYEQDGNDSTLLFRSLTGLDVDFRSSKRVSQVFTNISINF